MKLKLLLLLTLCCLFTGCLNTPRTPQMAQFASSNRAVVAPIPTPIKSNTAVVISPHANLRDSASVKANVLEVIPVDSSVKVIKQQGAWFYVKTETVSGWMHGNTLKLQTFELTPAATPSTAVRTTPPNTAKNTAEETATEEVSDSPVRRDSSRDYITGPRGGCYYINRNGNKSYVDRSLCGGGSDSSDREKPASFSSSSSKYIRGPRGGCYYINGNGNKTYVDRSLCD